MRENDFAGRQNMLAERVRRDGKAKLQVIGQKSIKTLVHENVKKKAILITDYHPGYEGLKKENAGH